MTGPHEGLRERHGTVLAMAQKCTGACRRVIEGERPTREPTEQHSR